MWAQIRNCKESSRMNICCFLLLKTIKITQDKNDFETTTLVVVTEAEKWLKDRRL